MSIALPVRRRRSAAWGSRVRRSTERPLSAFSTLVEFMAAPVAILLSATFFTSEVQILGGQLGLRQGAVGSRLAGGDTEEGVELPRSQLCFLGYGRQGHPGFWKHHQGHDLPEHHTRAVRGESGLSRRLMGEAERR